MITESDLQANMDCVRSRIEAAAHRVGRAPGRVRMVAVTKGHPAELVRLAYHTGLRDFGENRVDEARAKQAQLADLAEAQWHMIGHVQSRRAKDVIGSFAVVHSVDRPKIALLLNRLAKERKLRIPVLLECNISGEVSKDGWDVLPGADKAEVLAGLLAAAQLPSLEVQGLMTMAPWTTEVEVLRNAFGGLARLRDELSAAGAGALPELSMGMTDDFEIAVEEGATMVRIGRALFGERPPGVD
jgi:pyridoxal phosphate enzyme (YggS family)